MPLIDSDCAATYKILVIGDTTVGKSSILRCLTGSDFKEKCLPTIGIDFVRGTFEVDGAVVKLNIWDTAGQRRFHSVTTKHYRGVQGIVLVYDITDRKTFCHLSFWVDSVNKGISNCKNKYDTVPMMLVGNKVDLECKREVTLDDGKKLANKIMAFDFIETSAKLNNNVFMAFKLLAQYVTETFDPKVMKSYHPYMLRPAEVMQEKRKENDLLDKKEKNRFKKDKKTKLKPKTNNQPDFTVVPEIQSGNGDSKTNNGIEKSEKSKQILKKGKKKRGLKLTKRKIRVIKTQEKNERQNKKRRTIGFLWRKLFRRKRKSKTSQSENSTHRTHSCVIS